MAKTHFQVTPYAKKVEMRTKLHGLQQKLRQINRKKVRVGQADSLPGQLVISKLRNITGKHKSFKGTKSRRAK